MFSACGKKTDREYLSEVLDNMNEVNSVKYHCVLNPSLIAKKIFSYFLAV